MEKGDNISEKKSTPKVYFIISYLLFLAMALCWSLDDSIVLITLGGAVYFLFLGFYAKAQASPAHHWKESGTHSGHASVGDILKNIFSRGAGSSRQGTGYSQPNSAPSNRRLVVPLVFLAIFGTFFILILSIIFNTTDDNPSLSDYYDRAELQYAQGDYDSAYVNYRRAWQVDEANSAAMVGYGNVLAVRDQYDSAALMYDKAFAANPEYLDAAYAKGAMYYNLDRYAECVALMEPLVRANENYYNGMLLLGDCHYALKQYDDAIGWYENAYQNGGARSSALCHIMAYIYDTKGEYAKAVNLYREALEYDSSIVDIYKRLGELLPDEEGNLYRAQAIKLQQQ